MNPSNPIHAPTLRACIEACRHAASTCIDAAARQEAAHRQDLQRCAELCNATADQLEDAQQIDANACRHCAELCSRCAERCEEIGGLEACADACRSCAQLCLTMTQVGADTTPSTTRAGTHDGNGAADTAAGARKSKPRGAIVQRMRPDPALAGIVGSEPLTRADVTRRVWAYIKEHGLQDPRDRRRINADERLRPVFDGSEQITMFEMSRCINRHLR